MFSDFPSVESYLNSLVNYEARLPLGGRDWPKLEPVRQAVARMELPTSLSQCVHVAGTKGKGSTVYFLEALLTPDYSTLSFSSPHLVSLKERVRWNGRLMGDDLWCQGFTEIVEALRTGPVIRLTYFECTFLFYLWTAHHLKTDMHLVETGLGGRWDATNIMRNTLAVLTLVDYDHTDILGHSLTEIAGEKAGIIKHHSRVVVARQSEEALQVFADVSRKEEADVSWFGSDYWWKSEGDTFGYEESSYQVPGIRLVAKGIQQRDNASTAARVVRLIAPQVSVESLRERLSVCQIPGRQQLLEGQPDVLVDVAHNAASFTALAATLRAEFAGKKILAVVGLMKDKPPEECFGLLQNLVSEFVVVSPDSPRAFDAAVLARTLSEMGLHAVPFAERAEAFTRLHADHSFDFGLVTGSFYLVGEYLTWRQNAGIA